MRLKHFTPLKGTIILTNHLDNQNEYPKDAHLYKFVWATEGSVKGEIDNIPFMLQPGQLLTLSPHHHLKIENINGKCGALLFNSNFYCIFGHDEEVSCNGLLFTGSSEFKLWDLSEQEKSFIAEIIAKIELEFQEADNLKEEMLRILLKQFIIFCTRLARKKFTPLAINEKNMEVIRQYYVLIDEHFRTKHLVREYASLLNRSPKTLSNVFATAGLPSPLRILHNRIEAEAKRLLIYTTKSAKEIAFLLGFEDTATFSRFFSNQTGESITIYRNKQKKKSVMPKTT